MADDYYGDSPYARDWSLGAFAPPGLIWLGDIPLPVARELVAGGAQVYGQPLPPLPPFASTDEIDPANVDVTPHVPPETDTDVDAVRGAGPPDSGPPDQGGPEEGPPTDFDEPRPVETPLPAEPAPGHFPVEVPPPLEGEIVGPDVIYHDYEGYDQLPGGDYGAAPRRIIEGETEQAPWWFGPVARRVGRVVLGPYGSMAGQVIEAGLPEILGSGELPFPPIPRVSIPAPEVLFPSFPVAELPDWPAPGIDHPPVPDVITVTPEDPWPVDPVNATTPAATAPRMTPLPARSPIPAQTPWWLLMSSLIIGKAARTSRLPVPRPISQGSATSESLFDNNLQIAPDPLSPPPPFPGFDPLTPFQPGQLTSPQTGSGYAPFVPTDSATTEEQDRCRCPKPKKEKKKKKSPSSTIAHVKVFDRRMSTYSLKNLRRGLRP